MTPLGLPSLPVDVLGTLRTLPVIAERLELIAEHTGHLPTVRSSLVGVRSDTSHLAAVVPLVQEAVESVSRDTSTLAALNERMTATDERLALIQEAMPILVDVQRDLAHLPEAIDGLQSKIDRLAGLMEGLLVSIDRLDGDVGALQDALAPVARVADRLPGGHRRQNQSG